MMADRNPTFAFEGDEVHAILDGQVIASGKDIEEVEEEAKRVQKEKAEQEDEKAKESRRHNATHIMSPNGLKGTIQNRYASWDSAENVTVRYDNGRVVTLPTHKIPLESFINEEAQRTAAANPIESLKERFSADFEHDKESLEARLAELDEIKAEADALLQKGASYTDERDLDQIIVHADAEKSELGEALEHLEDVDNELAAPFETQVVEQAAVNTRGEDASWLDDTVNTIVDEANAQDFEKILDDGPVEFAAQLPDALVADQGLVQQSATDYITSKTAGLEGDEVEKFKSLFVERTEVARKRELVARKAVAKKEASVEEPANTEGPDEGLFI